MLIVKVPGLNSMGKTDGCREAGNEIIASLGAGKHLDIEEIRVNNEDLEEQNKMIYENSLEFFQNHEEVGFLGGDHSISFSIGKAFSDYCRKIEREPCLIVFDAHADSMKPGKEPTHEEWLRGVVEAGFPASSILLVGARKIWDEENSFLKKNKIKMIDMNKLGESLEETTDVIMEFASGKELYVSLDIDVVDPAFAPSTNYKEPGGLTSRQILYIVSRINKMKNLKAFDIVEVDSEKDKAKDNETVRLASRILAELV